MLKFFAIIRESIFKKHKKVEKSVLIFSVLTVITISIGTIVEIVPVITIKSTIERVQGVRPYTPLELAGKNIYIREGCYGCHSQQIRTLPEDIERYGHYSLAAESMFDYPFLWGSKRTGPDLARVGKKFSNQWHTQHLIEPRSVVPDSIMPGYGFLIKREISGDKIQNHLKTLKTIGVPYTEDQIKNAKKDFILQATPDLENGELVKRYGKNVLVDDFDGNPNKITEMDALVAYLQVLGTFVEFDNIKPEQLEQ